MNRIHAFDLQSLKPQAICKGGTRSMANVDNFHILKGMALYFLELDKGGVREPHWHPNASELGYCLAGKALMTIFSPGASHDTFTVDPGEIVFVPKGYLHHIENICEGQTKFAIAFNHERPEDIGISGSLGSVPDHVLDTTFVNPAKLFSRFKRAPEDVLIASRSSPAKLDGNGKTPSYHKFNLKGIQPMIQSKGGNVSLGDANSFRILNGLACYLLTLRRKGVREPHWHPNAAELDYVINGRARMTIFSPGNNVDTFEVGPGEIVFIPPAYFHYIENISEDNMQFAIFFNHERPEDIGISGSLGAYSNDVLAAVLGIESKILDSLPKYQQDLFVVAGAA